MKKKVVITGVGIISPIGIGKEAYLQALKTGKSGTCKVTYFDASSNVSQVDAEVKGFVPENYINRKRLKRMDRFVQFGLTAAKMAIEDASLDTQKLNPERVGVIIGSGIGGLSTIEKEHSVLLQKGPRRITPFLIPMLITNITSGEVAIEHGFKGPNYSVTSACATSNHAIGDALRLMRYGDADVMIAGGTEAAITALGFAGFDQAKALATGFNDTPEKASRPFEKNRSGFVMGEGTGIVVLETEEHAKARGARIYAELAGYGATDDAYHITAPSPDAKGAMKAIRISLEDGGINPEEVDYVNAHGTSTPLNDKSETFALKQVFGEHARNLRVSSTKSMTGHMLGAAGGAELIATLLCMENNFIHPTINYETPDPDCDLDYVPNQAREGQIKCAISNSLGFGGHNATIAVKKYG